MNRRQVLILAASFSFLASLHVFAQENAPAATEENEVQITAKKYEFQPDIINVKQGDHVRLVITAKDHDHGFKLKAYNINQRLKKGVPTTIEFTADQAGTFPFECSVFCGLGHPHMKGKLVVEPAPASSNP
jgi:cytochrome c oxidase subunit II